MGRKFYLECASGISGDMLAASLLDLGADEQKLRAVLESLPLDGYQLRVSTVEKSGIACRDFDVRMEDNHDHDMDYLYGSHTHQDETGYAVHHGRHLSDIIQIIDAGKMSDEARVLAKKIFAILAQAEGKVHGVDPEEVHFHEVGAVDSIVDIVSIAVLADDLGMDEVYIDALSEGKGMIRCQHGILPVPVPAVSAVSSLYDIPLRIMDYQGEFVTPTGIAAVAALWNGRKLPERFRIIQTGYGAGKRKTEAAGFLRVMEIETEEGAEDRLWKLQTNIDDCSGQVLGYTQIGRASCRERV